jgi:3-oxoacyl-[acyl-carrier-protein] synthase II
MQRRVVVTAVNMLTALGVDLESSWAGLVAGRSGVRRIRLFDPSPYATQIAAQVPEEFEEYSRQHCTRRQAKQMARGSMFGYVCTKAAIVRSRIDFASRDPLRTAVLVGAADTGHSNIHDQKYWILKTMPHAVSAWISMEYGFEGPNFTISSACASSAYAIAYAYDLIAADRADVVIATGASSIVNPEHVSGFHELGALSLANDPPERASRPFSIDRDGFVIGEGAGTLVLESEESALARGAEIVAEVAGYAMTSEAHNLMAPRPDGSGMARTMHLALKNAAIPADQVDYINAHGTSTPQNDRLETLAIKQVFGETALRIPVTSAKSMLGHTAGACGAIEAVITIIGMQSGYITPTINYTRDPELDLDYVPNSARRAEVEVALSNSFAFGGCNATLVFRKYHPGQST